MSESHDCNLIDILPLLLRANNDNEFVSILIVYDILKIIKNLYKQHDNIANLNKDQFDNNFSIQHDQICAILFDLKSF